MGEADAFRGMGSEEEEEEEEEAEEAEAEAAAEEEEVVVEETGEDVRKEVVDVVEVGAALGHEGPTVAALLKKLAGTE